MFEKETKLLFDIVNELCGDKYKVHFGNILGETSVVAENDKLKYEFYIGKNPMFNNEIWLYSNWDNSPAKKFYYGGGGCGDKIELTREQIQKRVKNFLSKWGKTREEIEKEQTEEKQLTIFDMI